MIHCAAAVLTLVLVTACGAEGERSITPEPTASTIDLATRSPAGSAAPAASPTPSATASPAVAGTDAVKTAFVRDANGLCREFTQKLEALEQPQEIDDLPPWLRSFIGIMNNLNERFRALRAPSADAGAIDTYLDGNDAQQRALEDALPEVEEAAETDDGERADRAMDEAFTTFGRIAAQQDSWARGYGLRDCVDSEPSSDTVA